MMDKNNVYFEISAGGNSIRIELLGLIYPNAELDWDENWVSSTVYVKAGAFSGVFKAEFLIVEFSSFKDQLVKLYDKLNGVAVFDALEEQVEINIIGDGIGHLKAK